MSIEIVSSPKNGVTLSLAGHQLLAGYRFCFTFDALKRGSAAEGSLSAEDTRLVYRSMIKKSKLSPQIAQASYIIDQIKNNMGKEAHPSPQEPETAIRFDWKILDSAFKKANTKLDVMVSRLHSLVTNISSKEEVPKEETPGHSR